MRLHATKDTHEREDDEAERLVRPSPKQKPPRKDLRRQTTDADRDPDTSGDPDLKGDPDMSMNYKNVGGSLLHRVVARFIEADLNRPHPRSRSKQNRTPMQQHGGRRQQKNPQDDENVKVWDRKHQKNVFIPKSTADNNRGRYQPPKEQEQGEGEDKTPPPPTTARPGEEPTRRPDDASPEAEEGASRSEQKDEGSVGEGREAEPPQQKQPTDPSKATTQQLVMQEVPEAEREAFWNFVVELDTTDISKTPPTIYDPEADDWLPIDEASEAAGRELLEQYESAKATGRLQKAYAPLLENPNARKVLNELSLLGGRSRESGEKESPLVKTLRELKQKGMDLSRIPATKHGIPEALGMPLPDGVKSVQDLVDAATRFYQEDKKKAEADRQRADEDKQQADEDEERAKTEKEKAKTEEKAKKRQAEEQEMLDNPDFEQFVESLPNADFDEEGNPVFIDPYANEGGSGRRRPSFDDDDDEEEKAANLVQYKDLSDKAKNEILQKFKAKQQLKAEKEFVRNTPELKNVLQELRVFGRKKDMTDDSGGSLLVQKIKALKDSGQKLDNLPVTKHIPELKGKLPPGVTTVGDLVRLSTKTTIAAPKRPPVSAYEAEQSRLFMLASLPHILEVNSLKGLHPIDQEEIAQSYGKWKRSDPADIQKFLKEIGGLPDDIDNIDPPKTITIENDDGDEETVLFDSLKESEQAEQFQKYKNNLKALHILKRNAEAGHFKMEGAPRNLWETLAYAPDRDPKEFFNATVTRSVTYGPDLEYKPMDSKKLNKFFKGMTEQQKAQSVSYFQAQDYVRARDNYIQTGRIDEHKSISQITSLLGEASDELSNRTKVYPANMTVNVAKEFRHHVLKHLSGLVDNDKYEAINKWVTDVDTKEYEKARSKAEKARAKSDDSVPMPVPPPGYAPRNDLEDTFLQDTYRHFGKKQGTNLGRRSVRRFHEKTASQKVLARYLFCAGSGMMTTATHQNRQSVYWGVEPYPKGEEGFAPYNEWEQAQARDLTEKDDKALLAAAKDWLKQPILGLATMGEGEADARYRAALDFAIQTTDNGRYGVGLHPAKYNELLARLAGQPTNRTLTTIREASVSLYSTTPKRVHMSASSQIRTYASKLASQHPALAFDLMNLSDKIAQQEKEEAKQEQAEQQKQAQQQEKEQAQQEAKQQKQAYMALRAAVIRTAKQNPVARLALKQALQVIQKVG